MILKNNLQKNFDYVQKFFSAVINLQHHIFNANDLRIIHDFFYNLISGQSNSLVFTIDNMPSCKDELIDQGF